MRVAWKGNLIYFKLQQNTELIRIMLLYNYEPNLLL